MEQTAEPGWFDAAYEFDAPRHHDFESMSPNDSRASAWFERQDQGGETSVKSPLQDIQNSLVAPVAKSLKKNIVTSWGAAAISSKKQPAPPVKAAAAAAPAGPSGSSHPAKESGVPPPPQQAGRSKQPVQESGAGPSSSAAALDAKPAASTATANHATRTRKAAAGAAAPARSTATGAAALRPAASSRVRPPPRPATSSGAPPRTAAAAVRPRPAATEVQLQRVTRSASKKMQDSTRRKLRSSDANSGPGQVRSCVLQGGVQKKASVRAKRPTSSSFGGGDRRRTGPPPVAGAAAARLKKALQPRPRVAPVRSTKELTLPDDVDLKTDHRARATEQPSSTPFKPLAVKVLEFQRKTPARFRSRPAPRPEHPPMGITDAKEPSLKTSGRARPTQVKPHDQQELEELEAMPKFHARPLNPLLLSNTDPLPNVERRAPTETQPFMFVTDDRAEARQRHGHKDHAEEEAAAAGPFVFKAAPLNRHILEGPEPLPAHKQFETTVPQSPMLMTKKLRPRKSMAYQEESKPVFHARPVPDFIQVPREFSRHRAAPVATQPFHLATDDRHQRHAEEEAARQAAEKAAARAAAAAAAARAGQLPLSLDVPNIPPRPKSRAATQAQPFKLESEVRHAAFVDDFARARQQEEAEEQAEATFKARPMPHVMPMMPLPSDQPLTVPDDVHLPTEQRAVERQRFDETVEEKMRLQEEERLCAEEAARLAEEEATRRHRETLKFEARPLPTFQRPFMALPSAKPLTAPQAPKLGRSKRQRGGGTAGAEEEGGAKGKRQGGGTPADEEGGAKGKRQRGGAAAEEGVRADGGRKRQRAR